jgi:predicted dehydrogenase
MANLASIGAAVIGTGFIGTVHVEALRRIGVTVRGVLGSTPERGAARADALGVPKAYRSLDDLLADDRVDVVHVTSPNDLPTSTTARHARCSRPASTASARSHWR